MQNIYSELRGLNCGPTVCPGSQHSRGTATASTSTSMPTRAAFNLVSAKIFRLKIILLL
jgi:hypothetical protein